MRIRCGFEIAFDCPAEAPMLLMLNVHPDRRGDLETPDVLLVDRDLYIHQYLDGWGNICSRVLLPPGRTTFSADFIIRDSGLPEPQFPGSWLTPVQELPDDVIVYLLGSRYCETDRMSDLAWSLFGNTQPGWERVQAILAYSHKRIAFDYERTRPTKTAWDAHEETAGVCRDYAHLAITLCRCMNIPARYCTGYLGDIPVPLADGPMDFSAWFEVWLDGGWRAMDARHNVPRVGRIVMAHGRDATDAAISTSFGPAALVGFTVITEDIGEG